MLKEILIQFLKTVTLTVRIFCETHLVTFWGGGRAGEAEKTKKNL